MTIEPRMFVVGEVTMTPNDHKEGVTTLGSTALMSSAESHTSKRKPTPVPKSCQKQKSPVINPDKRDDSANKREQSSDAPRLNDSESLAKILDASTREDVQDGKGAVAFQTGGTRLKASSGEDANLYEEVQNEGRRLPDFPEVVESRNTAPDERARGENCGKNPQAEHGRFSAHQGQREDRMKQVELHNKSPSQGRSKMAVSASEKISRMLLMESEFGLINKAAGKLISKTKEEKKSRVNKARICEKSEGNITYFEDHLYDRAKDVDPAWLDKSSKSELLYDGIVLFNTLDSTQSRGPICNEATEEMKVCVKEEPVYAEVTDSLEEEVERKEPFYDRAVPFVENVAREPAVKPEESFYDEISLAAESHSTKERTEARQPLSDVASTPKRYRRREQAEHLLYGTALAVKESKLPHNERLHNLDQTLTPSSPEENPYCLAASVHGNFSDGSSDEDESIRYSLLIVKMSMKRNNQILSRNCESLEKKAYRLSRLWGDAGPCAKLTARTRDEHEQPRPGKNVFIILSW